MTLQGGNYAVSAVTSVREYRAHRESPRKVQSSGGELLAEGSPQPGLIMPGIVHDKCGIACKCKGEYLSDPK